MEILCALLCCAIPLLGPTCAGFAAHERWLRRAAQRASLVVTFDLDGQGAFRTAPIRAEVSGPVRGGASGWRWFMAFTCWALGQTAVLWCLAGCAALLAAVDPSDEFTGAVSLCAIPIAPWCFSNAVGAVLLWRAGSSLVGGERARAERDTRLAATVVVGINAPAVLALLGWQVAVQGSAGPAALAMGCVGLIVHALLMRATFDDYREQFTAPEDLPV